MKYKNHCFLYLHIFLIIFLSGCFGYNKLDRQNLAFLYNDADIYLQPEFILHHISDDTSKLYFKVNTDELLYARDVFMGNFVAKFSIKYELVNSFESKVILDSATYAFADTILSAKKEFIIDSIKIPITHGQKYILSIKAHDMQRNKSYTSFISVNKENNLSAQSFLLRDENDLPLFKNYFSESETFIVKYNKDSTDKLFVKYYVNNFPIATPPFHNQTSKSTTVYPDSIFSIAIYNNKTTPLQFKKEGIYRIMSDSSQRECLTIFRFHEDFPSITLPEQMLNSARYITTRKEYDDMKIMADKKKAIENFWLNLGGNSDRTRQLIKEYYGRVKLSNKYFTSYHEGWKTDRGMIYIVFGPPTIVYRNSQSENWVYGEASTIKSINFIFYKVENPFTENDYMMSKSELFKDVWYYAVSNWRR